MTRGATEHAAEARETREVAEGIDYDGRLALAFEAGRSLLPDAEVAWAEAVAPYLSPGELIADIGAGTGRFARLFKTQFEARVIAIEPAAGMRAQRNNGTGGDLAWAAGRAEALPLRQGTVDVAWLCCVIHYLHLPVAGAEIRRVLRPDGRVLIRSVFPDRFDDLVWLRWFPAARAIDEARMPTVDHLGTVWNDIGLRLEKRMSAQHLVADDLNDLADRLSHRAISTLELISDDDFNAGLDNLRSDAHVLPRAPVYSTVDTLVFTLS